MGISKFFNRLTFKVRPALRGFYGTSWFIAFTSFYFRRIIPAIRVFVPLYGVTAILSLTQRCQCSCPHCGARNSGVGAGGAGEFTPEEIKHFIDDLARLGGACVHFFGGEPLIVSALPEYVAYAKSRGLMATVDTNGLLLNEEMVLKLKTAGIDIIRVSLDSPREEEHDAKRGVKGAWKKALAGLRLCVKHGIPCYMGLYATKENLFNGDLELMIAMSREIGSKTRFIAAVQAGKWSAKEEIKLSKQDTVRLRELLAPDVFWETEFLQHKNVPFWCNSMLRNKFDIASNGDLLTCSYMPGSFGNIRKEPLEVIIKRMWGSEMFNRDQNYFDCPINNPNFINSAKQDAPQKAEN